MKELHGSCQCGGISFHVRGSPKLVAHCHCNECRHATGAAFSTYVDCRRAEVTFDKGAPQVFESAPGVRRSFCGNCGSPIAWESNRNPDVICLFIGLLNEAGGLVPEPNADTHTHEKLPWLHLGETTSKTD